MLSLWLIRLIKVREGSVGRPVSTQRAMGGLFLSPHIFFFLSSDYSELPLPDLKELGQFLEDREAGHLDLWKLA